MILSGQHVSYIFFISILVVRSMKISSSQKSMLKGSIFSYC